MRRRALRRARAALLLGVLLATVPAAAYPVERMARFEEAPLVHVVAPAELEEVARNFAARFASRRHLPVHVLLQGSAVADDSAPRIELFVDSSGTSGDPTITLGERRIQLHGSRESIVQALLVTCGPPLVAGGPWSDRRFDLDKGSVSIRFRAGSLAAGELEQFAQSRLAEWWRIAAAFGCDTRPDLHYVLYESYEQKGLETGSLAASSREDAWLHVVYGWDARGDDGSELARMLLETACGPASARWLAEGLPLALAATPAPHDAMTLAGRLAAAGELPSLAELQQAITWENTSWRRTEPAAAAYAAELLRALTPAQVLTAWREGLPASVSLEQLELASRQRLADLAPGLAPAAEALRARGRQAMATYQRGFCYAHEGYQIHNGYVGSESARSLDELHELGCDWVSLTPFIGFGSTTSPELSSVNRMRNRAGAETDEQVYQAAVYARRAGMGVLLKPHLWGHGGWCGDIAMQSEADWQKFFSAYGDFVLHYALFAAEHEIPILSVGNELPGTTLARADDWRRLIARVRRVYTGAVVYCANWNREFEELSFWDALDACAVSCYFPLSASASPTDAELAAGARGVVARLEGVARRTGKPVILTELGYAPQEGTWSAPYQEAGQGGYSLGAQERCYVAFLGALAGARWCGGVYVWKWPSTVEIRRRRHGGADGGFSPRGRPAERVIRKFFNDH